MFSDDNGSSFGNFTVLVSNQLKLAVQQINSFFDISTRKLLSLLKLDENRMK